MSAQLKVELVATPSQRLRQAITNRNELKNQLTAAKGKLQHFAPIEAELQRAEAALNAVLANDSAAMQAWMEAGAAARLPEPDHAAREAAARKITEARARLSATGGARSQIDAEITQANFRHDQSHKQVSDAESEVLGHELVKSATSMKDAAMAYITAEKHHFEVRSAFLDSAGARPNGIVEQASEIGKPLTRDQEAAHCAKVRTKTHEYLAALRRGQEL